jgi:starch phosphorylase
MKDTRAALVDRLPARLKALAALAYDMRWSWNPDGRALWARVAASGGEDLSEGRPLNPVELLLSLTKSQLRALAADRDFRDLLGRVRQSLAVTVTRAKQPAGQISARRPIAYLSMEFAIDSSIPMYSGGLGILAGDHFKSASDLGMPLVGIGLAYRRGYYQQQVDRAGKFKDSYPRLDPARLPLELVRDRRGAPLHVDVELPGAGRGSAPRAVRRVRLGAWRLQLGSASLYFLDSDVTGNRPRDRALTDTLYGGDREKRIAQEILVGIGGARLLQTLGIVPSVWHLNEGHVAFCTLDRLRGLVSETEPRRIEARRRSGLTFEEAVEVVAANTVFTTHTPVPAGNEVFDLQLARRYLEPLCRGAGFEVDDYLGVGLDRSPGGQPLFSMTVLAMRLSRFRNGVSRLHGEVARGMWSHLWPGFSRPEIPIRSITNGVHASTWTAPEMGELYTQHIDADWRSRLREPEVWKRASSIPDREIWNRRNLLRERLVEFVRARTRATMQREGHSDRAIERVTSTLLDPNALTIGFARRFALYKRAGLLFSDLDRARKLFASKKRPLQIIYAGKPHPQDTGGIELFERIARLAKRKEFAGKVVLLENYDMDVGRMLVQGVDVWLNNPRRPLEASGTSGQKVPFNGGLNASVLDGWWDEAYRDRDDVGWAIGQRKDYSDDGAQDRDDSGGLYRVLERGVVPLFYERGSGGVPRSWIKKIKASMAALVPAFNTDRMVQEYYDFFYGPAWAQGECVRVGNYRLAREIVAWKRRVDSSWPLAHVRDFQRTTKNGKSAIEVDVFLASLCGDDVDSRLRVGDREFVASGAAKECCSGVYRFRFLLPRSLQAPIKMKLWPYHSGLIHSAEAGMSLEASL